MRFSDAFLEDIRQRLPISQVVGEYVQWDKRKSQAARGDYWACCPFHGEKTPSFHADDRRGRYHCFGCGVSGDHFRFLTEHGGFNFPEAVKKLAGEAGIALPARDEKEERRDAERASLHDVLEIATQYFEAALANNIGARARGYLNGRGVSPLIQTRFRIGFAPDSRNGLKEHLAANGINAAQMAASGLVVHGDDIAVPYDRFRNRVMFPIADYRGKIIAFGGRALDPNARAKYLNSPETELFHKRQTLYNLEGAQKAARGKKPLIVVEGYLDVIAAVTAGFEGAVAPLGTALSEEHVKLLWRVSEIPVLCFDGDEAGQRAMARTCEIVLSMLEPGKSVKIATLPDDKDPDDLIREQGAEVFGELIANGRPLVETIWAIETKEGVPNTPEGKAALEMRLADRVKTIGNSSINRHYFDAFKQKLQVFFAPTRQQQNWQNRGGNNQSSRSYKGGAFKGQNFKGGAFRGAGSGQLNVSENLRNSRLLKNSKGAEISPREAVIVNALVNHPSLVEEQFERLAGVEFASISAKKIVTALIDLVTSNPNSDAGEIKTALVEAGFGEDIARMERFLARQGIWQSGVETELADAKTGLNHALALHYKSVDLNKELKAAELALGHEPSEESFERLRDIQNQITSVDGTEALIEGFGLLSGRATPSF